jgi:hypothetical protein
MSTRHSLAHQPPDPHSCERSALSEHVEECTLPLPLWAVGIRSVRQERAWRGRAACAVTGGALGVNWGVDKSLGLRAGLAEGLYRYGPLQMVQSKARSYCGWHAGVLEGSWTGHGGSHRYCKLGGSDLDVRLWPGFAPDLCPPCFTGVPIT